MINFKKLALIAGAAVVLAGCSLTGNGSVNTTGDNGTPTATPATDTMTPASPNPSGSTMGSQTYQLQGTAQGSTGTDDTSLNKDLNNVKVDQNLDTEVK
ncbi:MAG TPA: hypothetical protein VFG51_01405 [Candidatus Saccharimonadia bacterium]|nr:hypothetical protein [Candidatus Saccharimonadia bacterium]